MQPYISLHVPLPYFKLCSLDNLSIPNHTPYQRVVSLLVNVHQFYLMIEYFYNYNQKNNKHEHKKILPLNNTYYHLTLLLEIKQ